jgi:alanyl-tRNA synthetase
VIPGNEGRGYVQRRIVRRAIRHGYKLGQKTPFFHKLVADLVADGRCLSQAPRAGSAHHRGAQGRGRALLRDPGQRHGNPGRALAGGAKVLPGEVAFKLHDTYGFPLDLTNDVCRERGVTVDEAGFNAAMEQQKAQARAAGKFKMDRRWNTPARPTPSPATSSWPSLQNRSALRRRRSVQQLKAGQNGVVVLDTPRSTPNPAARWARA